MSFTSNLYRCKITFGDYTYNSVEHAYQASKTIIPSEREAIRNTKDPLEAKRLGGLVTLRDGWDTDGLKVHIMYKLLTIKFEDTTLRNKLITTGDRELVELNDHNDTYWGVCNGKGNNMLGKLLMKVRADIRKNNYK